jgi:hypothetical protein
MGGGGCFCLSAGAYTITLYVMLDIVIRGGCAPLHPHQPGIIFPYGMYARKPPLPLCVNSARETTVRKQKFVDVDCMGKFRKRQVLQDYRLI